VRTRIDCLLGAPNQGESDDKPSASIALRREKRQDIYPVEQKSMQGNAASVQRHFSESKTPRRSPLGDPHPPYSYKAGIGADVGVGAGQASVVSRFVCQGAGLFGLRASFSLSK
jgi:hypothetical protein